MSFLAPLFLLGGLAIGLPVVFHLIRRTTSERTPFSSLMFLNPSPPRLTRRSRLEHLLLLALRCLVLLLLATGFARPFLRKPMATNEASPDSRRTIILLDTSASMKRAGLWPAAVARAEGALRNAGPGDQMSVYSFDRQLHSLVTFDEWNRIPAGQRVSTTLLKLSQTSPGWSATRLGDALINAAEILADTAGNTAKGPAEILVITDLQEGCRPEQLQGYDWPKGISVEIEPLKPKTQGNASLHLVTETDVPESTTEAGTRLRVNNSADSKREQFKLGWAGEGGKTFVATPLDVYVPAGQNRMITLNQPDRGSQVVLLQGDDDDFDNQVFVSSPQRTQSKVIYFGLDLAKDVHQPLYFLERAFQETRRQAVRILVCPPDHQLPPTELQAASLLVSTGVTLDQTAENLRALVSSGKTLLFAVADEADRTALAYILGAASLTVKEAHPAQYAMLSEIDFQHPLFSAFADPRFSDFTKIHFWKYRIVRPTELPGSARVIAKFDTGDPALIEAPLGKGRVLVLTSTWQPSDSQLALSTKFVPLLYAVLEQSAGPPPAPTQYYVGDPIPVGAVFGNTNADIRMTAPDRSQLKLGANDTNFSLTMAPGIYTLSGGDGGKIARFAVNIDPLESRTAPLALDEFERLGVPVARQVVSRVESQRKAHLQNSELENRQKLWRWFLLVTIAVLLTETWLAGRTTRSVALQGGTP
jgi:hypothetical protein